MRKGNDGNNVRQASILGVAALLALSPVSAFAYIDPGSGSLLLQIVMSALFGALFLARNFIAKGVGAVRRFLGGRAETPPTPPDEPGA